MQVSGEAGLLGSAPGGLLAVSGQGDEARAGSSRSRVASS